MSLTDRSDSVLVESYRRFPIAIVEGEGCLLRDAAGRTYVDLMAGIATCGLGHCHPRLIAALEGQARKLWHSSNLFHTVPQVELAERLTARSFAEAVFFANSGTEVNEAALKLARRWHRTRGDDRFEIVAFRGSFHGRTLFSLSATGEPHYWEGFEPLVPGVRFASFGDLDSVRAELSPRTAAVIVEAIQGEGGVRPASREFLHGLRALTRENGALLILDEVQTGVGRTGSLFAHQHFGIEPDVMTLAKALGNGIPIGAMCTTRELAGALTPGSHASTFGGNPLAAACGVAVLDEVTSPGFLDQVRAKGELLGRLLESLARRAGPDCVVEVRGVGLLRGVELRGPARPVLERCQNEGVLLIQAGERVVRIVPPLVIPEELLEKGIAVLESAVLGA